MIKNPPITSRSPGFDIDDFEMNSGDHKEDDARQSLTGISGVHLHLLCASADGRVLADQRPHLDA